jgi:hypothetical protein
MGEAHRYHEEWFHQSPERAKEIDLKNILLFGKRTQWGAKDFELSCFWRKPQFPICISSAKNRNHGFRF